MTDMRTALKESGIRIKPQMQLIWEHLKANPGLTAKRVLHDLKLAKGSVSSLLAQAVQRGMLEVKDEFDRLGRKRTFFVPARMTEYELLPKPVASPPIPVEVKEVPMHPTGLILPPVSPSQQSVVDKFTVAEAREMYGILHKMFGEKK